MSQENYSFVRLVLNELNNGLGPFVVQEFAEHFGRERNAHLKSLKRVLSSEPAYRSMALENDEDAIKQIDIAGWLKVMRLRWDTVFKAKLGEETDSKDINVLNARAYIRELIDGRNKWGHETQLNQITVYDALRISGTAERLLLAVGAAELAESVRLRKEEFAQKISVAETETHEDVEEPIRRVDLSGLNLSDMDLRGRNLHSANLTGADLSSSNLSSEKLADMDLSDIKLLKADLSNANLANSRFVRADLSDAILRDTDLKGTNLSHTTMERADLRKAKIDESDFRFANLTGADLSNHKEKIDPTVSTFAMNSTDFNNLEDEWERSFVDFSRANLREANMQRIWLNGVSFTGADMTEANLAFARMVEVSLIGAILQSADLTHCDFIACDFTGAKMQNIIMRGGICKASPMLFDNADMSGANFESFSGSDDGYASFSADNADLSRANLSNADLAGSSFRNVNLTDATLIDVRLDRSDLTNSNLTRAVFKNANLVGANLSNSDLNETDFTDADLTCADFTGAIFYPLSTVLPDGTYWTEDTDMTKFTGPLEDC